MARTVWVCRKHENVELFEESNPVENRTDLVIDTGFTAYCKECEEYYYKYQCKQVTR
jgi:hypothetical protein